MKVERNILNIISKYLNRTETTEEREQLYQWYEDIDNADQSIEKEAVNKSQLNVKKRLLAEISEKSNKGTVIKLFRYKIAAACIAVALCAVSLKYYIDRNQLVPLKQAELENIVMEHHKATITLSSGKVINLDTVDNNESIQTGNAVIKKDELGQLVYTSAVNEHMAANVINTLQTSKASQYSIILSDGTKVFLNASSRLSYPEQFGKGDRTVKLYGEAYFEVKKTSQHSKFIVKTNGQAIEVLGTKFNVSAYGDIPFIKTTLAEGSVRITPVNKSLKPVILKPNQQAILSKNSVERTSVDVRKSIVWKEGYFVFDKNNTQDVISEIGKWYDIEIENKRENKSIEYEGKIPKDISLAQLIDLLNYAGIKVQAFKNKDNKYKLIIN